jgi:alpha-beta hydrolase superfamily lysophospholipase
MNHVEGSFRGAGGLRIHTDAWSDERAPSRAVVVVSHGAGEHAGRYRHVVERLAPYGFALYALDHRGHGRSEGRRAVIDRMANAIADLDRLVEQAATERPGLPVYLLGHSLGGCIAIAYALEHQRRLAGLVLSAPAAALEAASPAVRALSRVLSTIAPNLPVMAIDATAISRDPDEVRAYLDDPLVYHRKLPVRTVAEAARAIESFPSRAPTLQLPLLVMHGSDDRLTPPAGSHMIHERAGSADKTLQIYAGLYHEIFNELPADREQVIADLASWLVQRSDATSRSSVEESTAT